MRLDLSGTSLSTDPAAPSYQWFLVYWEPLGFVKEAYDKATIHTVLVSVRTLSPQSFHPSPECRFVFSVLFGEALVNCCGGVAMDWKFFPRASHVKSRCLTSLLCTCPKSGRNPDEAGRKPSMMYARKCELGFIQACDLSTHLGTGSPLQAQRSPKWDYQLQTDKS